MESLRNEVLGDPFDPSTFNSALVQGNGAIRSLIANEQIADEMFDAFRSDLILSNTSAIAAESPVVALDFLNKLGTVRNNVDQEEVLKLRAQLTADVSDKNSFVLADLAESAIGIDAQADLVDDYVREGNFTPSDGEKAIRILEGRNRRSGEAEITERDNRLKITLQRIDAEAKKGKEGQSLHEFLSAGEKAQLRFDRNLEFVIEYEQDLVRGEKPGAGNAGVYIELLDLGGSPDIEDIDKFINTPIVILHAQGVLSTQHAAELTKLRNKAKQDIEKFRKDQQGIRTKSSVIKIVLGAAGLADVDIDNVKELGQQTKLVAELEGVMEEFRVENGRVPTSDELQSLGLGLLTKIDVPGFFDKAIHKLDSEFVEEEFFTINQGGGRQSFPRAVAGIMADGLRLVDVDPTPENIRILAQASLERGVEVNKLRTAQDYADIWKEVEPEKIPVKHEFRLGGY